jgi:hypothetical protein
MRRGQVLVRAIKANGDWGNVDALDLDDESFRAFILVFLCRAGVLASMREEYCGEEVILRERKDE